MEAGSFHDTQTKPYTAQDFRFTTKGDTLYAIEMGWPGGEAVIQTLASKVVGARSVSAVSLLGVPTKLEFTQREDGLHIKVPAEAPGKYAYAYRISFEGVGH